jgi:hypothetical protein
MASQICRTSKNLLVAGVIFCLILSGCSNNIGPASAPRTTSATNVKTRTPSIAEANPCGVGEYEDGENGDGSPDCVPDDSGGGGGGGGGGGVNGGGGAASGGGKVVASYPPAAGDTCGGSDHALGETWPPGSEPSNVTTNNIVNINEITEPAPNGGQVVVGWTYLTAGGQYYVEENSHEASPWANLINSLPPLGNWNSAVDDANAGSLVPSSSQDVSALYSTESKMGGTHGSCFTHSLTYG